MAATDTAIEQNDWYLATAKPRQESRALENLANQDIVAFAPLVEVEKIRSGRRLVVTEALFPGYLFINISPTDGAWQRVRSTRGLRDWVRFSGAPARVPSELVNKLRLENKQQEGLIVRSTYARGDRVRILEGPFAGLQGVFETANGIERSLILVEFLGKTSHLELANKQISAD